MTAAMSARSQRQDQESNQQNLQHTKRMRRSMRGVEKLTGRKLTGRKKKRVIAAISVSWLIIALYTPFYLVQLSLFLLMVGGAVAGATLFLGLDTIGVSVAIGAAAFGALIGVLGMLFAALFFSLRRVPWYGSMGTFSFAFFLAMSMLPLFLIPWVFIWCGCVVLLQTGERN